MINAKDSITMTLYFLKYDMVITGEGLRINIGVGALIARGPEIMVFSRLGMNPLFTQRNHRIEPLLKIHSVQQLHYHLQYQSYPGGSLRRIRVQSQLGL